MSEQAEPTSNGLLHIAILATAYFAIGWLTLLASKPLDYAPFVWLPTGLAYIGMMVWGMRCWPGVFIGAFSLGVYSNNVVGGAVVSAVIALAATLQAAVSLAATRKYFSYRQPVTSDANLLKTLVYAGPISCTIVATAYVVVQLMTDRIGASEVLEEWLLWWAADSLGIIIGAPLLLMLWPSALPEKSQQAVYKRLFVPLVAIAALFLAGNVGFAYIEKDKAKISSRKTLLEAMSPIARKTVEQIGLLRNVAQLFTTSELVTREEFGEFTKLISENPAIRAVDWAPRVDRQEMSAFEGRISGYLKKESKIRDFPSALQEPMPRNRPVYYPIQFTQPAVNEANLLGLDHASVHDRRQAMVHAVNNKVITEVKADSLLRLKDSALLVYLPVFENFGRDIRKGIDLLPLEGKSVRGFVVGVYDLDLLFNELLGIAKQKGTYVRIIDYSSEVNQTVLLSNFPSADVEQVDATEINLSGIKWRMEVAPIGKVWKPGRSNESKIYLLLSTLASLAAVYAALGSAGRSASAITKLARKTDELERELRGRKLAEAALKSSEDRYRSLINLSPFATLVHCGGEIVFVNPMAVKIFGARSPEDLLAKNILDFVAPESRSMIIERRKRRLNDRGFAVTAECDGLRVDGTRIAVAFTSTLYEFDGREGSLVIIQDITAQKEKKELVDRFFEMSQDLLCIVSNDGLFQRVNAAFTVSLGWSEQELTNRPLMEFVHPDDMDSTAEAIKLLNSRVQIDGFENRYICKDGSARRLEWKALPQPDGLFFASARDCTERHETADKLKKLNAELAQRVDERSEALLALRAKEQEVRAVLDNLLECVITIDERGIVKTVNPALERILGYCPREVIGADVSMLMASPYREEHHQYLANYISTGKPKIIGSSREVVGLHKSGRPVPLMLSVSAYVSNGVRYFLGTLQDISVTKQLIHELTRAREDAEQANRAKSAFLASMSHEIRTPMNGVIGLVDVLDNTGLNDQQSDLVRTIKESSSTLLGIIDDILDFSKIESGNMQLESTPLSVLEIAESVCSTLLPVAIRKKVDLHVYVSPKLPVRIMGDEVRLYQILSNLLGNAIKFSSELTGREGRVALRVEPNVVNSKEMLITVSDNGIGISEDKLKVIFNAFIQAETSTTRRYGGTGLGLAITLKLIDMMGGRIHAQSAPDRGANFEVCLPINAAPTNESTESGPSLVGVRCVALHGQHEWEDDYLEYLQSDGCEITKFDDIAEIKEYLRSLDRVVFLNFSDQNEAGLIGTDGVLSDKVTSVRLTRGRRRDVRIRDEHSVTVDVNALRRATLIKAVGVAAGRASPDLSYGGPALQNAIGEAVEHSMRTDSVSNLKILIAEDDPIGRKVIMQQLAYLGHSADVANNGADAFQMWRDGHYHLIITDLHMPELDGYDLARSVRAVETIERRIPILALTANALKGEEQKAYAAGIDAYLTKPIRLDALKAALQTWLIGRSQSNAHANGEIAVDLSVLMALIGNDESVVVDFLSDFISVTEEYVQELNGSIDSGDLDAVAACVHKIKSAARSIGALPLGALAKEIEVQAKVGSASMTTALKVRFNRLYEEVRGVVYDYVSEHTKLDKGDRA